MNKPFSWGLVGITFIVFAGVNFVVFLLTGSGLTSRMGHQVKGWWAVLGSLVFFALGLLSLFISSALKFLRPRRRRRR